MQISSDYAETFELIRWIEQKTQNLRVKYMKDINVLVTGGGSPGIAGTIHSLKNNFDNRQVRVIATDAREIVPGRFLADGFYVIPRATDREMYLAKLSQICKREKIDVLLPQNTSELLILAENKSFFSNIGVDVVVSDYQPLIISNNKYELLKLCEKIKIPYPEYYLCVTINELEKAALKLGWPDKPIVVKPPESNGSRGLRVIDDNKDYKSLFYDEKPTLLYTRFSHFKEMIGETFPPLLVMEYLPGQELTLDVFRHNSVFLSIPRIREEIRSGISFQNSAINDAKLISYSKEISDHLDLLYCYGFQFKYDEEGAPKILECNPRVQGTMVFATFMGANMIYSAVKAALGEKLPSYSLDWDTKLLRYWGAIGITQDKSVLF